MLSIVFSLFSLFTTITYYALSMFYSTPNWYRIITSNPIKKGCILLLSHIRNSSSIGGDSRPLSAATCRNQSTVTSQIDDDMLIDSQIRRPKYCETTRVVYHWKVIITDNDSYTVLVNVLMQCQFYHIEAWFRVIVYPSLSID